MDFVVEALGSFQKISNEKCLLEGFSNDVNWYGEREASCAGE